MKIDVSVNGANDDWAHWRAAGPDGSHEREDLSALAPPHTHVKVGDPLSAVDPRWLGAATARGLRLEPRGAHVNPQDPLLSLERRAFHARARLSTRTDFSANVGAGTVEATNSRVGAIDRGFSIERRALHAPGAVAPAPSLGVHARKGDPLLSVEGRAMHASKGQHQRGRTPLDETPRASLALVAVDTDAGAVAVAVGTVRTVFEIGTESPASPLARVTGSLPQPFDLNLASHGDDAGPNTTAITHTRRARRGLRFVPAVGAAAAVAVGIGGGSAVAFVVSQATGQGTSSGVVMAGKAVSPTVTATTGPGDLLPGSTGSAYFRLENSGSSDAVFAAIAPGATIVSNNTELCGDEYVSIARTLPYTLPTPLTVRAGGTTGKQTIAGLVALAPDAPSTCQGVTFTVTFTLSGAS